ncbi:MAG: xanthine dehydrogenase family protein molybdopterin-binding subunit [Chloroflexota bacterium]|nr:xanthine dehydrogenase family protein molybdopterin-binding subunit [Chloroflexota bacterium]MDQ5865560.1 xanthine dehydrogenase family protein molybdopterin-binding subunit [Chloroflexota bacterium]
MTTLIGASVPRPDALGKVTGATKYPADLVRADMLHLKIVFAHRPHARILKLDTSKALEYPGVVDVLTAADVPFNAYGLVESDQPAICGDKVRYVGDRVAVVVAETVEAAEAGAGLVQVEYEDLPPVTDARAAMSPDSPLVHDAQGTNVLGHVPIRKGDADKALAEADLVLVGEFTTSWQEHAYLQPEAGIAYIDQAGKLVIETAGQWLHEDRKQIAAMLKLSEEDVIIRYAAIGGAFGGREDLSIQHLLALATWKLKRPTAIIWSREESMFAHHKRHPFAIRCQWGAMKDGRIVGVRAEMVADGGAYASTSVEVLKIAALFGTGTYEVPNISVDGYVVYTNNVPCGAFRGFGAPQAQFAVESMVTRLAHALGIDPIEMRRRNIYREGSIEPSQHPLPPGVSALPVMERCVEEAVSRLGYGNPRPEPKKPHLRRGVGIACGIKNIGYSFGYPDQATAEVELYGSDKIEHATVRVGAADVGQGAHTILRQIAAETLGLPFEHPQGAGEAPLIEMVTDDSGQAPNAGSASASRMTYMGGRAVYDAAKAARVKWDSGERPARARVQFRPEETTGLDPETTAGTPNFAYGYAAQAVEVEVDTLTGLVQVLKVISVHDVGKAVNRQQVEGQIEGCLAQALGYALLEDFQMRDGKVLTPYFSTYLLPTALDMPTEIVPVIMELADPAGPYGARGMAEMPLVPLTPAIAIAIHDAMGVWLSQQPMTPERVLTALRKSVS